MAKRKKDRSLISMVTDRAERSFPTDLLRGVHAFDEFPGKPSANNYRTSSETFDMWEEHWLKTAQAQHADFVREGLNQTAAALQRHIDSIKGLRQHRFESGSRG